MDYSRTVAPIAEDQQPAFERDPSTGSCTAPGETMQNRPFDEQGSRDALADSGGKRKRQASEDEAIDLRRPAALDPQPSVIPRTPHIFSKVNNRSKLRHGRAVYSHPDVGMSQPYSRAFRIQPAHQPLEYEYEQICDLQIHIPQDPRRRFNIQSGSEYVEID